MNPPRLLINTGFCLTKMSKSWLCRLLFDFVYDFRYYISTAFHHVAYISGSNRDVKHTIKNFMSPFSADCTVALILLGINPFLVSPRGIQIKISSNWCSVTSTGTIHQWHDIFQQYRQSLCTFCDESSLRRQTHMPNNIIWLWNDRKILSLMSFLSYSFFWKIYANSLALLFWNRRL